MAALAVDRAVGGGLGRRVLGGCRLGQGLRGGRLARAGGRDRLGELDGFLGLLRQLRRGQGLRLGRGRGLEGRGRGGQRRVVGRLVGQGFLGRRLGRGECFGRGLLGLDGLSDRLFGGRLASGRLAGELLGRLHDGPRLIGRGLLGL